VLVAACGPGAVQAPDATPPAVGVVETAEREVNPYFEFVGKTQAVETVALRARVTGFLQSQEFEEGGMVEAGQVLYRIQPEQYTAMLAQAEGELAAATASLNRARVDLKRFEELVKSKNVPQMRVDEARAEVLVQEAAVKKAEAAIAQAQLDLDYTEVRAPIDGRIDVARLHVGNLVGPDSGVLSTINKMDPVQVVFSIAESWYLELARLDIAREQAGDMADQDAVVPRLRLDDGEFYAHQGQFDFVDNKVDPKTGTVRIRAEFPNPDRLLLPGQFVTVLIERKQPRRAVLIPQAAVLTDQGGHYVLLVDAEDQVEVRRIETGQRFGADLLVEEGLGVGERLIYSGLQKVRPGITVTPEPISPIEPTVERG
jgi:membrane fusion protein (multidrug efflux system)